MRVLWACVLLGRFFAEHGLFSHIVHILSVANKSSTSGVVVQLLQTLNIMLQNIRSEKAVCAYPCSLLTHCSWLRHA